jgi:hypothetical protein
VISILVPSRGRAEQCWQMARSAYNTAVNPDDIELVVRVDDDDPQLEQYHKLFEGLLVGPRDVLSKYWNECHAEAQGPIYMHCGDDIIFRTEGWDEFVKTAFDESPDKILFVHGKDGIHDEAFGTHGFIHKNWTDIQGYFVPPYYSSDYNDTHLNDIANLLGRRLFLPFYTEHMHFVNGKAPIDQTHRERLERHSQDRVDELYHSPEKVQERQDIADRLRKAMQ